MYSRRVEKYNKCHIRAHTSLYDFPFDFLIFSDLLSYENNQELIFKVRGSLHSFAIFLTYHKSFDVFFEMCSLKKTKACINQQQGLQLDSHSDWKRIIIQRLACLGPLQPLSPMWKGRERGAMHITRNKQKKEIYI